MTIPSTARPGSVSTTPGPSRFVLWGPVVAYMAVIFALSSITRLPELPGGMTDKNAHALEYSGLAVLTLRALARGTWAGVRSRAVVGALLIAVLYGLSDEAHQFFVPGRQCDMRDVAADALGAGGAAGALWAWSIIRRFSRVRHDSP